jgi:DNA-binding transcriptional MerR regulator
VGRKSKEQRNGRPIEPKYTLGELQELTGVSARTLGKYTSLGLVPRPVGGGRRARYGEVHLLLLLAIDKLHTEGVREIDELRARLDAMSDEDLDAYTTSEGDGAGKAANGRGGVIRDLGDDDTTVALPTFAAGAEGGAPTPVRFTRHELAPGLELHLRDDAPDGTRLLAEAIVALSRR